MLTTIDRQDQLMLSTVRGELGSQIAFVAMPSDRKASVYTISAVQAGIYGHHPLDLLYSGPENVMRDKADALNKELGITDDEVVKRVTSSMVGSKKARRK